VKVQCELCREIVALADFTPSVEGISIRCPACSGTYFVPAPRQADADRGAPPQRVEPVGSTAGAAAQPQSSGVVADAGGMACPKCGRRQAQGGACRYCGLVFALWDPTTAAATNGEDESRRRFAAAEAAWSDLSQHEAFIEHCSRTGQLPYAARCYRDRLARDPDDAVARAQQARVVAVAELTCLTRPRELADAPLPHRGVLIGAVIALFVALLGILTSPLWRWWK
jgi:hypothetical protein